MNNTNGDFSISITISLELVNPDNDNASPSGMEQGMDQCLLNDGFHRRILFHFEIPFKE
jgi:hypothetical protein